MKVVWTDPYRKLLKNADKEELQNPNVEAALDVVVSFNTTLTLCRLVLEKIHVSNSD